MCVHITANGDCSHEIFFFFKFLFFFPLLFFLILTCVPKHEPPTHLPPHNISLGHPHAPAPSMLYPASHIDWRLNSYMIVYMLECHSPKSSQLSLTCLHDSHRKMKEEMKEGRHADFGRLQFIISDQ